MAKKKGFYYRFADIFIQDKLDDYIFAYFSGVRSAMPYIQLIDIAAHFQRFLDLNEDDIATDIIIASYTRSLEKYRKYFGCRDQKDETLEQIFSRKVAK
jgi:hypothetical protein